MGTVWLFFSWAKDVIFQPAVGPDVVILKSSLKGTAKASSSDMQTEQSYESTCGKYIPHSP